MSFRRCRFHLRRHFEFGRFQSFCLRLVEYRCLAFDSCLRNFRRLRHWALVRLRRSRGRGRLGRHDYLRGRAWHRLRRNETWGRLCLHRCCRLYARGRRRRPRRYCRGRRNDGPGRGRRSRARRGNGLGGPLRDRLQHIPRLGDMREIDLGLKLVRRGSRTRTASGGGRMFRKVFLDALRFVLFDRAGVRFLLGDPELGKNVEDFLALDLEFPRQIINSNLVLHYAPFPPICPVWLRLHSILTVVVCV